MEKKENKKPLGTQSLNRGLNILNLLSAHHAKGLRLTDISRELGLEASTAHRLTSCLMYEHFVERDPLTKRYRLGIGSLHLGVSAKEQLPLTERMRPIMQQIAQISGDTVFLVARQGDFALCLHREHGSFPVHINTTLPGSSRLLGIGAGGSALMSVLTNEEVTLIYDRNASSYEAMGLDLPALLALLEETRVNGFSQTVDVITKGITAIGMAIPMGGRSLAAISIGSITSRMDPQRRRELGTLLAQYLNQKST